MDRHDLAVIVSYEQDRDALLAELDAPHPESWVPKEAGETIVGVFARIDRGFMRESGEVPIMVLVVDPATRLERAVWLVHVALLAKLEAAAPTVGETVAIKYEGRSTDSRAHRYRVAVRRPNGTRVDWRSIAAGEKPGGPFSPPAAEPEHETEPAAAGAAAGQSSSFGTAAAGETDASRGAAAGEPSRSSTDATPEPEPSSAAPPIERDGTSSFRCGECMTEYPNHAAGCSQIPGDGEDIPF